MSEQARNLIVAFGTNASGKTRALTYFKEQFWSSGVPCEGIPFSDGIFLFKAVLGDGGGCHHEHPWCRGVIGHNHLKGEPHIPFTVIDKVLPDAMFSGLLEAMVGAPFGKIHLVEWASGINQNERLPLVDFSVRRVGERIRRGDLPTEALKRVLGIVHIITPNEEREKRNEAREGMTYERKVVQRGEASFYVDPEVLKFFGVDDFHVMSDLAREFGVPRIFEINNVGPLEHFETEVAVVAQEIAGSSYVERIMSGGGAERR